MAMNMLYVEYVWLDTGMWLKKIHYP